MECLAQVRFGLCFASKMFYTYYCSDDALQMLPRSTKVKLEQLHQNVKHIVTEGVIREPRDFLVKQLVRQYGFTYLEILSKKDKFKNWIIETNQVCHSVLKVNSILFLHYNEGRHKEQ